MFRFDTPTAKLRAVPGLTSASPECLFRGHAAGALQVQQLDKKKATAAFRVLFANLRDVLHQHDPSGLFALGCPEDEHGDDINWIISLLQGAHGPGDVAQALETVLGGWFSKGEGKTVCGAMAPAIWIAWSAFLESSR